MPVDPGRFRAVMARWPTGVTIVTAQENGRDTGLTVNAFLSVSLTPPLVLVSLTHDADATPVIRRTRSFAISILAHDQREISERFAKVVAPAEKFAHLPVRRGRDGLALIDGALATLECTVVHEFDLADHHLYIGEVVQADVHRDDAPLLFYRSRYAEMTGPETVKLAPPDPAPTRQSH